MREKINIIVSSILLLMLLANCGSYRSKFESEAARGLYNLSLSHVDELITSGLIEDVSNQPKKKSKKYGKR